jgi:hypothetical protein
MKGWPCQAFIAFSGCSFSEDWIEIERNFEKFEGECIVTEKKFAEI